MRVSLLEHVAELPSAFECALLRPDRLGKLAPGYLADLIVLDQDPFDCHPSEMLNMTPSATMLAGEWVWQT